VKIPEVPVDASDPKYLWLDLQGFHLGTSL